MYMKNIVKAFVAFAGIAGLAACAKPAQFNNPPFVILEFASATVEESSEAKTIQIPVLAYGVKEECTVTYAVEAVTAKEGVDFSLPDASGILKISPASESQSINIVITGQPGVYTGNTQLKVKLVGASNGVVLGASTTCAVTIKDLDHPLSELFGDYTMKAVSVNDSGNLDYVKWTINISPAEGSSNKVRIDHITPFAVAYPLGDLTVTATVSADKKTMTIAYPQDTGTEASPFGLSENFFFYGHEGTSGGYIRGDGVVTFTQGSDGAWTTTDDYGFSTPSDTDDLFYYYAVVFSSFNGNYPTFFVKK